MPKKLCRFKCNCLIWQAYKSEGYQTELYALRWHVPVPTQSVIGTIDK